MAYVPNDELLDFRAIKHTYKSLALEAFSEVKAEMMAEARNELPARDVRMAALQLAQHMVPADQMISFADILAQYVLTGKKPSAEG